jgi:hypothetical protein
VSVPATPGRSINPTIGRSASSFSRFAWFAGEFHAIKHERSDGCAGAASVELANTKANVPATSAGRTMP